MVVAGCTQTLTYKEISISATVKYPSGTTHRTNRTYARQREKASSNQYLMETSILAAVAVGARVVVVGVIEVVDPTVVGSAAEFLTLWNI